MRKKPHTASPAQPTAANPHLRERLLTTFLAVVFYYYPSLLLNTWSLFACYQVDRLQGLAYPENSKVSLPDSLSTSMHSQ